MTLPLLAVAALAAGSALLGSVVGIGGATLLVPVLLALGVPPIEAAPIGLLTVGASSLAAGGRQLDEGRVHHRIGLTFELAASAGAAGGALVAASVSEVLLARILGVAALVGAAAAISRTGIRNRPSATFGAEAVPGEWPGTLGGQYVLDGHVVPYHARHVPAGLAAALASGIVSGLSGVGAGFLKTPAMSEIMKIPVKVAAATTTFTLGITATTGLLVYAIRGDLGVEAGSAALAGAFLGGLAGARLQTGAPPTLLRWATAVILVVIAGIVIGRTL
ncbi:sulfite exporter TauE/SafE family protein [Dermatobacter hominis]|uniref:sulfite exporter TauE/SafE family protein n=1 Tax=Dermatobacter hominis TaxID=2884263 RepID=UPI001D1229B0|nr:sulfite exporter TauE/SafE family protein [Dermatobacter hominis]UDY36428.1 sulfite exporter TauE/SafE family protein [Dermatobacter hominis]